MRDCSPGPLDIRYASLAVKACTPRKSNDSACGMRNRSQFFPESTERKITPCDPLAQIVVSCAALLLTSEIPRRFVSIPRVCTDQDTPEVTTSSDRKPSFIG